MKLYKKYDMGLMMTANLLQKKTGNSVVQTYQACQLDGPPEP
jgi:hypothetical protein